ncbi:MAG TPA: NeuD/PglB/VioB family sugar acetyltransferase [Solirubrobacteraceae bacterium]|jgi:sugar O-acyltransferase (sialic acid O-acetyltransferase NeuD family)|nr:NeuD/PglB/VioB family sugar acetyltransferase [Solirubrobacteraceae bacterium]
MTSEKARELLLVGAGGLAREAAEAVRAANAVSASWNLIGFLDDDPGKHGMVIGGIPVLDAIDAVHDYPSAQLLLCPGRPDNYVVRRVLSERLGLEDERYATIIHPAATVGTTCAVGPGSLLLAHADLTADVVIGRHVVVMPQVVLTHDVQVGDWATLASGVRLGGASRVEDGAYLGSGACVREGITVGAWAMIGMGAVVTRDVPAERLWYGNPARDVSRAPLPVIVNQGAAS